MKIVQEFSELPASGGTAVSIGNFDGIHAGHRVLVSRLCQQAQDRQLPSVVVTFDPHPIEVLAPGQTVPRLTTNARKAELLNGCGVDFLFVLNTNEQLLELDYADFFQQYVVRDLDAKIMVEGPNFFFGKDRKGNTERLKGECSRNKIELTIVEISETEHGITSSSAIRRMIVDGSIEQANRLLIDNYQISGTVSAGAARGREIGFPTANLADIPVLIPGAGVYAGITKLDRQPIPCAIHIGPNPTFEENRVKVEVHLIDQDLELYDRSLNVEIVSRVRGIKKFSSQDELVLQIKQDINDIKESLPHLNC